MSKRMFIGLLALLFAVALIGVDTKSAQSSVNPSPTPYPTPSPIGPMPSPSVVPFFPPNEPPPLPFTSLSLEILVPAQSVLLLEPVPLIVKLTNNGSRPASGYKTLEFGTTPIYLYVKKVGTNDEILVNQLSPLSTFYNHPHIAIASGESIQTNNHLTLRLSRYFPMAGSYEIRAKLANPARSEFIESEPVTLEVREPGPSDRSAYDLIRNGAFSELLFSGLEFERTESILQALTTLHPQSPYARHANFLLGQVYFHRRDYVRALPKLIRLENDNGFIFAGKVKQYLTEIRARPH